MLIDGLKIGVEKIYSYRYNIQTPNIKKLYLPLALVMQKV